MQFDQYLKAAKNSEIITVHPSWGQGRTTFGGLTAALVLEKVLASQNASRLLRSVNVNFSGPLFTDVPLNIETRVLSEGKTISHVTGEAIQDNKVVCHLTACFGDERNSDIDIAEPPMILGTPGAGDALDYIEGLTPEFVQYVRFTYLKGQMPCTNSPHNNIGGWVKFKDAPSFFNESHLTALIDAWPPTVLQKLSAPVPCATVNWSFELVQPLATLAEPIDPSNWLYYEAEIQHGHHGFIHTDAKVFHPNGELIAVSRQLVAVYDKR